MYHPQLKITYPDCPFVWDSTKINQTYDPNYSVTDRDSFLTEIIDHVVKGEVADNKNLKNDILGFISSSTHEDTKDQDIDSIDFFRCEQKLPRNLRDTHINFHTTCYSQDVSKSITTGYDTEIDWCLIPVIGDVKTSHNPISIIRDSTYKVISRKLDTDTKDVFSNKVLKKRMNQQGMIVDRYDSQTDNKNKALLEKQNNARIARRGFFANNVSAKPPEIKEKHDVFGKVEDKINPENPIMEPKKKQILLTNDTRYHAQEIRRMLLNKCKVSRLKDNPHLIDSWKRVDLSLLRVAPNVSQTNNEKINQTMRFINKDCFDYKDDKVGVIKTSGIHRFSPINSGKIKINAISSKESEICFVTLMKNRNKMAVTLHSISLL